MKHTSWIAVALATLCSLVPAIVSLTPWNDGDGANKLLYFNNKPSAPPPPSKPPLDQTQESDTTETEPAPPPEMETSPDVTESVVPILGVDTPLSINQVAVSCAAGEVELVDVIHRIRKAKPELDIVFLLDASGSMSLAMEGIVKSIENFCTSLTNGGRDIRIAGVQYKTEGVESSYCPFVPVSNLKSFKDWLRYEVLPSVGMLIDKTPEDNAIKHIPEDAYRPNAQRIYIVIADDDNHPGNPGNDTGSSGASTETPEYVMHTITTEGNNARKIANISGGYNLALTKEGSIDLSKLRLAEMILATNLVKVRHRLRSGSYNLTIKPKDGRAFPKQNGSFTVSGN
jgi:hypothetical protein